MADRSLVECPVCFETYRDPQQLNACGHSFCKTCLEVVTNRRCPICRTEFARQNAFSPNYALRNLMEDIHRANSRQQLDAGPQPMEGVGDERGRIVRTFSRDQEEEKIKVFQGLGLPWGLARQINEEDNQIALRIFLLDNSGSTSEHDGRKLVNNRMVNCTRWEETKFLASEQAKFNGQIGTPCEFMVLNPPCGRHGTPRKGIDFMRIDPNDASAGPVSTQIDQLRQMLERIQPRGPTPLADRIDDICRRIDRERADLARQAQKVVLVIATDGVPTGSSSSRLSDREQLIQSLRRIARELLVTIVIRLTTNDDSVAAFYNQIDEELEFPLEVLDDIEGEAKEIYDKGNGWLTYSPLMHKIREHGIFVKLFDLLDERCLEPTEAMTMARMMLQTDSTDLNPEQGPEEFCRQAAERAHDAEKVYNPLTQRLEAPVNVRRLHNAMIPLRERLCGCKKRKQGRDLMHGSGFPSLWKSCLKKKRR